MTTQKARKIEKILVLCHVDLIPSEKERIKKSDRFDCPYITEYDVIFSLTQQGYEVKALGVYDSVKAVISELDNFKPDLVFNLLEEFNGETAQEGLIPSLLESMGVSYTGASSKNLVLCRDKSLTKHILSSNSIPTPSFFTLSKTQKPNKNQSLNFPAIVKCLDEEASTGLSGSSIVNSYEKLKDRVQWVQKKYKTSVICEEFVEGIDVNVGVIIKGKSTFILPPWRVFYSKSSKPHQEIYGEKEKWNEKLRNKKGVKTGPLKAAPSTMALIESTTKKVVKSLSLEGYARIDFRLSREGIPYVLEINPNPNIASDDEFAESAASLGISYNDLLTALCTNDWSVFTAKTQKAS